MSGFIRGIKSINLFPNDRKININAPNIPISSVEQAMEKDINQVAEDFWSAIKALPEYENIYKLDIKEYPQFKNSK